MKKIKELYKQLISGEKPDLALWTFPIVGLLILFVLPFILTRDGYEIFNYTNTGQIGDTIGGIAGPVIALIAALLTFIAFWVQIKANKAQTAQFNKQDNDTKIDRFENKFYELIRLHKANVDEISISGFKDRKIEKRKAFAYMYRELRYTFFITKIKYKELRQIGELKIEYSDIDLLKLSYIFFYVGVGVHSDKLNKYLIGTQFDEVLCKKIRTELKDIQGHVNNLQLDTNKAIKAPELYIEEIGISVLSKSYQPFVGHINRFGHYYRHLFQTVKFVVTQDEELIDTKQKIEYLRTLRAQLSDHEQVMLYYNAVTDFGKAWLDNKYFTDYRMIHNIPLPLADFGIIPEQKFKKELDEGIDLFEWI